MPGDDRMSVDKRRKYLKLVASRYAKARRAERSALLTEMAAVTKKDDLTPANTDSRDMRLVAPIWYRGTAFSLASPGLTVNCNFVTPDGRKGWCGFRLQKRAG